MVDINKSSKTFSPDTENNQILFGLKGILNVGDDIVERTIENRPYASPKDYYLKIKPNKQAMVALIKAGAFDQFFDRKFVMTWFIWETCDKKKRLTLQNMSSLIKNQILPAELDLEKRVFEFNRYLKAVCKKGNIYELDNRAINFLTSIEQEYLIKNNKLLDPKQWDKMYQAYMDSVRDYLKENNQEVLDKLNQKIFLDDWNKYAKGSLSAWEMEVLCFYYHEHELTNINTIKYGLSDFFDLPVNPVIENTYHFNNGRKVNIFKLNKIYGTCIAKNKSHSSVTLLTPSGVVEVKFRKEHFALFDKRISAVGADGKKHIVEKSWFDRGNLIIVQGIRTGDSFMVKKYKKSDGHQLYKITETLPGGNIALTWQRAQGEEEEDYD